MDELESAVLLCLNPQAEKGLRDRALQYCQNIRTSPDGWVFVVQKLSISMPPEVCFWCLQVLHETLSNSTKYPSSFSNEHISGIRIKVLQFFSQAVYRGTYPQPNGQPQPNQQPSPLPNYVLNKLAQVIVTLIAAHYPQTWPNAMRSTVLALVNSQNSTTNDSIEMFFRILRTLDDYVTSIRASQINDNARVTAMRVKDAMRDDCIVDIINETIKLISHPKFVSRSFDLVGRYAEWVDIGIITNEAILGPIYAAITSTSECPPRAAAAAALRGIITKRMDTMAKVNLMKALRIDRLLPSIPVDFICTNEGDQDDADLEIQSGQAEVANLVNTAAVTALDVLRDVSNEKKSFVLDNESFTFVIAIAQNALPLALRFMNDETEDMDSSITIQSVTNYITVFSKLSRSTISKVGVDDVAAMVAILRVVEERSIFPANFDPFDKNSEFSSSFKHRREVLVERVFRGVARVFCEMATMFVVNLFTKAAETSDIPRTELALALLIVLTNTSPDVPAVAQLREKVIREPPKCMSFTNDIQISAMNPSQLAKQHQLEVVSTTYFDLVARSYRIFLTRNDPQMLSLVLPVFFDSRGLGHKSSEIVRSYAVQSLLKLSRSLRSIIVNSYLAPVLNAAQGHLFPVNNDISSTASKNQMIMFEIVGYLLGTEHKADGIKQYLSSVLQPLVTGLKTNAGAAAIPHILASGCLSKGFGGDSKPLFLLTNDSNDNNQKSNGKKSPSSGDEQPTKEVKVQKVTPLNEEMQMIWVGCLEAVIEAGAPCLTNQRDKSLEELRSKLLFFLHRMVDTIGHPILPYLERLLPELLKSSTSPVGLRDVIILTSQAVTKFGEASEAVLMQIFGPVIEQVHRYPYSIDSQTLMVVSEESREAVDMHRAYIYFIHAISSSKLLSILLHQQHQHLVQIVISSIISTAVGESLDVRMAASVMKMALHTLSLLIEKWVSGVSNGVGSSQPPGFGKFALENISSVGIDSALRGSIFRFGDYRSGQGMAVLTEIISLQKVSAGKLGPAFGEFLQAKSLKSAPKDKVQEYLNALYIPATSINKLITGFVALIQLLRSS